MQKNIGRPFSGNPMQAMAGLPGSDSKIKMNQGIVEDFLAQGKISAEAAGAMLKLINQPSEPPKMPPAGKPEGHGGPGGPGGPGKSGGPGADPEGPGGPGGKPAGGPPMGGRPKDAWTVAAEQGLISADAEKEMEAAAHAISHGQGVNCSGGAEITYDGADQEIWLDGDTLSTERAGYNAIKAVRGAKVHMKNVTLHKSGSSAHHECSFTGYNAGILAENGGKFYIEDSVIESDAVCGNNIFAHGEGAEVNLKNCLIDAYGKASDRAVYCSWGGTLNLENCELITRGLISAVVVTDTGGGFINAKNCSLKLLGRMSACIYSTGDIRLEHCRAIANEWESCVIVGNNSVRLKDCYVFGTRNQGVKVFTKEGDGATFVMEGGSLTACEGPLLFTCGNHAHFTLRGVALSNPSGIAFQADKLERGNDNPAMAMPVEGINDMYVDLYDQRVVGDTICDDAHTMTVSLHEGSEYTGTVNTDKTAVKVTVQLDAGTTWKVTGDSYVDVLKCSADCAELTGSATVYYDAAAAENAALGGKTIAITGGGKVMPKA